MQVHVRIVLTQIDTGFIFSVAKDDNAFAVAVAQDDAGYTYLQISLQLRLRKR